MYATPIAQPSLKQQPNWVAGLEISTGMLKSTPIVVAPSPLAPLAPPVPSDPSSKSATAAAAATVAAPGPISISMSGREGLHSNPEVKKCRSSCIHSYAQHTSKLLPPALLTTTIVWSGAPSASKLIARDEMNSKPLSPRFTTTEVANWSKA